MKILKVYGGGDYAALTYEQGNYDNRFETQPLN